MGEGVFKTSVRGGRGREYSRRVLKGGGRGMDYSRGVFKVDYMPQEKVRSEEE